MSNVKSRALKTNLLHSIFDVDNFLQCAITKAMLQSDQLIEYMVKIGIDRSYGVYHTMRDHPWVPGM